MPRTACGTEREGRHPAGENRAGHLHMLDRDGWCVCVIVCVVGVHVWRNGEKKVVACLGRRAERNEGAIILLVDGLREFLKAQMFRVRP